MSVLEIVATLLVLSAVFGCINYHYIRLPHAIGMVIIALGASVSITVADLIFPAQDIAAPLRKALKGIDFYKTLMEGFLSALLFAAAIHVDLSELRERKWAIGLMATLGILISTVVIAYPIWFAAKLLGIDLPFIWAMLFGALISPTDPVAVLGILKTVKIPPLLRAKITGESLFNDGVGVVLFSIILGIAMSDSAAPGATQPTMISVASLFFLEAIGGALLGLFFGLIAYNAIKNVNEHFLEVLITLALVAGTYAVAIQFHLSGPIAVVVAGLLIGNQGASFAMSEKSRKHVFDFWHLSDEILNSILFLLIGLEFVAIAYNGQSLAFALIAIPVVLAARCLAVTAPIALLSVKTKFTQGAIQILTWGGLRGGISVALALSLPDTPYKAPILAATYAVVLFSIIVQGLTMKQLLGRVMSGSDAGNPNLEHAPGLEELEKRPNKFASQTPKTAKLTLASSSDHPSDDPSTEPKKKPGASPSRQGSKSRRHGQSSRGPRKSKRARRRK